MKALFTVESTNLALLIIFFFINNILFKQSGKIKKDYNKPSRRKNYLQKNMNR